MSPRPSATAASATVRMYALMLRNESATSPSSSLLWWSTLCETSPWAMAPATRFMSVSGFMITRVMTTATIRAARSPSAVKVAIVERALLMTLSASLRCFSADVACRAPAAASALRKASAVRTPSLPQVSNAFCPSPASMSVQSESLTARHSA